MKFFRIILHPISKKSQLDLPEPLLSKYRESLPRIVTLGVPGGRKWKVGLKEEDGRVWLRRGWPEFATCLGLTPGYFLSFDYKQVECEFHVEVFDLSTLEIEYPIMAIAGGGDGSAIGNSVPEPVLKRPKVEENDQISEEDDSQIVPEAPILRRERSKSPGASKRVRTRSSMMRENSKKSRVHSPVRDQNVAENNQMGSCVRTRSSMIQENSKKSRAHSPVRDQNVAENNQMGNCVRTRSSTIRENCKKSRVHSPGRGQNVAENNQTGNCGKETLGRMTQPENDTKLRYVVKGRVPHGISASQIERALARAQAFKFDAPVIIVTMQPCYVSNPCRLVIPHSFIAGYFNRNDKAAILKLHDGSSWSVAYGILKNQVSFNHGWPQFVADNSLKVGDVCAFELVKEAENTLRVFISRAAGETCENRVVKQASSTRQKRPLLWSNSETEAVTRDTSFRAKMSRRNHNVRKCDPASSKHFDEKGNGALAQQCDMDMREIRTSRPNPKPRPGKALEQASKLDKSNLSFCAQLPQRPLALRHLNVPKSFWQQCPEQSWKQVKLTVPSSGRSWLVKYRTFFERSKGRCLRRSDLGGGLMAFVRDNNLREGNVCVFELVDKHNGVFNVHIFK